ncbi:hypothetical protein [Chondromyces apiculatus]|uniref:DUF1795 domain-containing protein n=1 Tax=Chondromyces apiculatus DSM 436 TaxID=1192034 RepID=A0A017TGS8_9BACT|nr:hypothetical protein [Chondromyces apiculatus]EYF08107.1 Hypothetical protein CAP_5867 [Chondromyces apiculatus DSM 436]
MSDYDSDLPIEDAVPGPGEKDQFRNVRLTPDAGPAYAYSLLIPVGWHGLAIPEEARTDTVETKFTPIGLFSPFAKPMPPVVLSVGVRLMLTANSIAEQFLEHCAEEGYEVLTMRPQEYAAGAVVEGLARQADSPLGPLKMRLAMFEDGGRLFGLSAMAPENLYAEFIRPLSLAMLSFELVMPQGQQIPLAPQPPSDA